MSNLLEDRITAWLHDDDSEMAWELLRDVRKELQGLRSTLQRERDEQSILDHQSCSFCGGSAHTTIDRLRARAEAAEARVQALGKLVADAEDEMFDVADNLHRFACSLRELRKAHLAQPSDVPSDELAVAASPVEHASHCHPSPHPPHRCICGAIPPDCDCEHREIRGETCLGCGAKFIVCGPCSDAGGAGVPVMHDAPPCPSDVPSGGGGKEGGDV